MVVVDTSVWVSFLRGEETTQAERLRSLLESRSSVALTDVVYMELLRGARAERDAVRLDESLREYPVLRLAALEDFALAASLSRTARSNGIALRSAIDLLIAAPCIRENLPLLHSDADFDRLASCTKLRIFD